MFEILLGGSKKSAGMTYTEFLKWMTNNSTKFSDSTTSTPGSAYPDAYARVQLSVEGGTMWGTPYLNSYTHDSNWHRIARHACPSADVFAYLLTNKHYLLFKQTAWHNKTAFPGLNRNGYASSSYSSFNGRELIDFIYYDMTLGVMMRWNPYAGTKPAVFDGVLI